MHRDAKLEFEIAIVESATKLAIQMLQSDPTGKDHFENAYKAVRSAVSTRVDYLSSGTGTETGLIVSDDYEARPHFLMEHVTGTTKMMPIIPKVPVDQSVFTDHLVCLECGRKLTSLKRHLTAAHGLTVDEYKSKYSLPNSYPIVCEELSNKRKKP